LKKGKNKMAEARFKIKKWKDKNRRKKKRRKSQKSDCRSCGERIRGFCIGCTKLNPEGN